MFDDYESTLDNDVSSLPREESEVYEESEVVTPDPEEESLPNTDQGKEDSPFHNVEFQFSEDKSLNFLMRCLKLLSLHAPLNSKNINALTHLVTLRKHIFYLTRSNPRTSILKALMSLVNTIR